MKNYKRLTGKKIANGKWGEYMSECYDHLAELEDKIENGTLIELPCKVGDTIWEISGDKTRVKPIKVSQIYFIVRWLQDGEFGKSLFLTEAQAEQKLKELRGEE